MGARRTNRLADETSPYLLQHATNPVDWFPWGEEAFEEARKRDVPVFLSVGYAACHWCHVMERESFEDDETAALLNGHFVPVKVDREERPDVDAIYMDAVQAMTGSGGWPMSVFLASDGRPFYAGTYFPNQPRHGMPSFRQVLEGITDAWNNRRTEVETQGDAVVEAIARTTTGHEADTSIDEALVDDALERLAASFDAEWGGFGHAPKFPQAPLLGWLLRQTARGRAAARTMALTTLDRMAAGGIHDQVGGGFARYSTDAHWHVPHFEKMLPDNAQLIQLYAEAWLISREPRHRDVAVRTADYLLRVLRSPEGAFMSSQDADSDGGEGRFYVWGFEELTRVIAERAAIALGARPEGNWEGTNVLWFPRPIDDVAAGLGVTAEALATDVDAARMSLQRERLSRREPAIDDKIIAAWNGLAIQSLSIAGRAFGDPALIQAATVAATFVWDRMRTLEGRLLRSWRAGRASVPGFIDDHALIGLGFLTLFETTGDELWFERAAQLGGEIIRRFASPEGGFYLTADDAEALVVRPTDVMDTSTPSGTAAASELLIRLSRLTGEYELEARAQRAIAPVLGQAQMHPGAFGHALSVVDLLIGPINRSTTLSASPNAPGCICAWARTGAIARWARASSL